jgi:hypothetical protein
MKYISLLFVEKKIKQSKDVKDEHHELYKDIPMSLKDKSYLSKTANVFQRHVPPFAKT